MRLINPSYSVISTERCQTANRRLAGAVVIIVCCHDRCPRLTASAGPRSCCSSMCCLAEAMQTLIKILAPLSLLIEDNRPSTVAAPRSSSSDVMLMSPKPNMFGGGRMMVYSFSRTYCHQQNKRENLLQGLQIRHCFSSLLIVVLVNVIEYLDKIWKVLCLRVWQPKANSRL